MSPNSVLPYCKNLETVDYRGFVEEEDWRLFDYSLVSIDRYDAGGNVQRKVIRDN